MKATLKTYRLRGGTAKLLVPKFPFAMVFILCPLLFISCENEIAKIKTLTSSEELPSITANGYEMLFSDSTVMRFKMHTPELIRHDAEKEPYTEFPKGVKIEKFDAKMNIVSSITAEYAKNFDSDQRWEAKNNVIAVNLKGDTLKTEFLVWDTKKEKIFSDQFVKIIRKDQIITGIGFESNQDFSKYEIKNPKGHLYVTVNK
ncbi:MAG: LPS export ABC transporter periplasmic protein LptC [Bacteroidia bacterium]|jgi:LPS export ABC transporter protein LptC